MKANAWESQRAEELEESASTGSGTSDSEMSSMVSPIPNGSSLTGEVPVDNT